MAGETPTTAPAPPDISTGAPPSAPDLSALTQGGAASAPNIQTAQAGSAIDSANQAAANYKQASDLASKPVAAPPPSKHATLLRMVEALGIGLSSSATALATHGREGGAPEVQDYYAKKQQGEIQAQQARQQSHDAAIQNALKAGQANEAMANSYLLLSRMPNELEMSNLNVQQKKQEVAGTAQALKIQLADFQKANWGFTPDEITGAGKTGAAPTAVDPAHMQAAKGMLTRSIGPDSAAGSILGADDPAIKAVQDAIADPNATPQKIQAAGQGLQFAIGQKQEALKAKEAANIAQTNDPVAKLTSAEALTNPGAQAAIQAKINDPTTTAEDRIRLQRALPQAAVAQLNAENIKARELRNQQIVNQGDPNNAGKLLANRTLTLEELKSRQVTPQFIAAAVQAAQQIDPTFKAPEAAAQAAVAKSPANSQFFGNTDSLLVKGGTLDQLAQAHAALGNGKIPFANKLENWRKAQLGQGPQAAFAASALGVADDYSKVISGGAGSDTSRQQALDIIGRDLSPAGLAASIAQIRSTIESQRNGRVSTNPYLRDMYPDPVTRQETPGVAGTQPAPKPVRPTGVSPQATLMQVPGGVPHWIEPDKVAAAKQLGATEVQ